MTPQYTNPVHANQIYQFQMNRLSTFSENSSRYSISSSPSISLNQQQRPTAPSEAYLKYIHNSNFENHQIESKQYHRFRDDY